MTFISIFLHFLLNLDTHFRNNIALKIASFIIILIIFIKKQTLISNLLGLIDM